jgi:regulator of cell morphogenesis and NO signaling
MPGTSTPLTPLTPSSPLATIASSCGAASRVLYRQGLDFCCGGHRSLAAACSERGLDPVRVLEEIAHEDAERFSPRRVPDESELTPDALIERIVDFYHARLRCELPELLAMATRVESRHAANSECPRGLASLLARMIESVNDHLDKEECIVFPLIRAGRAAAAASEIRSMEEEHADHGRNLARLRELTADLTAPAGACSTWRALYERLRELELELMEHIHLENHVLFPAALRAE